MSVIYDLMDAKAEYDAKMLHKVPDVPSISREQYLVGQARGKVVLDIGASGLMSDAIRQVAKEYHSMDRTNAEWCIDLDTEDLVFPEFPGLELVICGEVIEHLSNPGGFLSALWLFYDVHVIITTPNAFSEVGRQSILKGIEMVNPEHVAYYSYHTLKTLVERHGFTVVEWYWYNGKPRVAEGMIFRVEGRHA